MWDDKHAYTISEVEDRGPWGRTTIYKEAKAGRLKIVKIGGRSAITAEELKRYYHTLPGLHPTEVRNGE